LTLAPPIGPARLGNHDVTLRIRPLVAEDFAAWWPLRKRALELHPDAFGQPHTDPSVVDEALARERFTGVAIHGDNAMIGAFNEYGELVGTIGIFRESGVKIRHRAVIWGVFVDAAARGQRAGDALMRAAIAHARQLPGVTQVELSVASHNAPALALYRRLGFETFGRHPRALMLDGTPIDEDLMVLILDAPDT
jgi:ribosomal protein S18 acetylase RimI-like enzyme